MIQRNRSCLNLVGSILSTIEIARDYIHSYIGTFHTKRLDRLSTLQLRTILKRKNPYLFRAKNMLNAQDLVNSLLDAHLSSQEETLFGDFLEGLAIYLNEQVYGGRKSTSEGIDLEFDKDSIRYIVSIKSGPNWGNSKQIKGMRQSFTQAKRVIRTGNSGINLRAVNGCCYGKDDNPDKGDYLKLCGQRFWEFICGDKLIYRELIEPLGHGTNVHTDDFLQQRANLSNQFTADFIKQFCTSDGEIDWQRLVEFNSAARY